MLKFDLKNAGLLAALPYLVMGIVVQIGGFLADWLRSQGHLTTTQVLQILCKPCKDVIDVVKIKTDFLLKYSNSFDGLFGIVVSTSDCHPRGPGFDSRLYHRNFSGSVGSGTGSTQPREDNWVATSYEK